MSNYDPIVLDELTPIEIPVTLGKTHYVLREASADAARQYRNSAATGATFKDGGVQTGSHVGDVQPLLVGLCLYEVLEWDEATQKAVKVSITPVGYNTVLKWNERIVKQLFDRAKAISNLGEQGEQEQAKN